MKWNAEKNTALDSLARNVARNSAADDEDVIRVETELITCELLVVDQHGKTVTGLTANDFSITEDDTPQTTGHFLLGDNISVPRTIVLIIDYSGSQLPYLKNSIAAAKVLVDKLGPNDMMAIVTDDVELIHDFTSDKKKLKSKLDWLLQQTKVHMVSLSGFGMSRAVFGRSKQYSALMATLIEAFVETDVRPIIIFQTDGDEAFFLRKPVLTLTLPEGLQGESLKEAQRSIEFYKKSVPEKLTEFSLDDVYRSVERSRATVYTVIPGLKFLGLPPEQQFVKAWTQLQSTIVYKQEKSIDLISLKASIERTEKMQSALSGVAALTGGWTDFLENPDQADGIYARIFSDINQRYIVGYYPSNKEHDGKRRKIDFAVKGHPEYQIYGRRSYFAPSQ